MARFWRQTRRRVPSWDACLALAVPAGCAGMLAEAYGRTAISDAEPAAACAFAPLALSAANAETLTRRGLVVVDEVLSAGELAAARRDAATLARFAPAGDHGERGDAVCWVRGDDDDVGAGLRQAMRLLRGVPDALARRDVFGAQRSRAGDDAAVAASSARGAWSGRRMGMSTGTSINCGSTFSSPADNCLSKNTGSGTNKWGCSNSSSCVKLNDGTPNALVRTASHWICRPSRASLKFFTSTYREIALITLSRVSSSRVMRMSFCNDGPSFTRSRSKACLLYTSPSPRDRG